MFVAEGTARGPTCECGEVRPHLCSPMPQYRCVGCADEVWMVRLVWPDGKMISDGSDVWFSCSRHKGTLITPVEDPVLSDLDEKVLGPFARDSETSRQASIKAYPKQGTQRWRIVEYLNRRPKVGKGSGATRNELAYVLDLTENSIRPRVKELLEGGWIIATDRTRQTDMACDAEVLVLTEKALEELRRPD